MTAAGGKPQHGYFIPGIRLLLYMYSTKKYTSGHYKGSEGYLRTLNQQHDFEIHLKHLKMLSGISGSCHYKLERRTSTLFKYTATLTVKFILYRITIEHSAYNRGGIYLKVTPGSLFLLTTLFYLIC